MAWFRRKPGQDVIFHSDRGSQYASQAMTAKLNEYGMTVSMSRKGNCWDAPTESFFGHLKVACVLGHKFTTREQAKVAILDWMALYNHTRLHSSLGQCNTSNARSQPSAKRPHDNPSYGVHDSGATSGLRVVEIAALGPALWCYMVLACLGAEVIRIEKPPQAGAEGARRYGVTHRGRAATAALHLKSAQGCARGPSESRCLRHWMPALRQCCPCGRRRGTRI